MDQTLAEAQQLTAEVFGAEGAELAAGLTWTAVGTGQATATINEHVLVYRGGAKASAERPMREE
jgi:hypothetical protein